MELLDRNRLRALAAACALAAAPLWCHHAVAGVPAPSTRSNTCLSEPPSRFFPGKYFEKKAQCALKKKDYGEAMRMFKLGALYADKRSQYNVGIMYFNGIGVAADRPRGAAWLGIAAEAHDDLADAALQAAYATLAAPEREHADEIFRQLDVKYGDGVALPRALAQYRLDLADSMFRPGMSGPGSVTTVGYGTENSTDFVRRIEEQREELVAEIKGHVTVGSVQALAVPQEDKAAASHEVLDVRPRDEH